MSLISPQERKRMLVWNSLIQNVQRGLDQLYDVCNIDGDVKDCQQVVSILSSALTEFKHVCSETKLLFCAFFANSTNQSLTAQKAHGLLTLQGLVRRLHGTYASPPQQSPIPPQQRLRNNQQMQNLPQQKTFQLHKHGLMLREFAATAHHQF